MISIIIIILKKCLKINELITYVNNYGTDIKKVPTDIRNLQLSESIMYAKKYNLNTIKISENNYKKITFNLNEKIFSMYDHKKINMSAKNNF